MNKHDLELLLVITSALAVVACAREPQQFASPEKAVQALVEALREDNGRALRNILGQGAESIMSSGDRIADHAERERFLAMYARANTLVRTNDAAYLEVGAQNWLFPIPVVKVGQGWAFDTPLAAQEIVARRIGRNELAAILVSLAYVDAQFEYAAQPRQQPGQLEYAQKFMSTQGRRDGLYWQETPDQAQSPMGPLIAAAQHQGYAGSGQRPYHGYCYRILKGQGEHAADGAYDYVVNDHMIGGFALLAYPANYGNSGVMSFIVNHRGVVYEKDLGPDTDRQASALQRFDPDASWQPVNEQLLSSLQL